MPGAIRGSEDLDEDDVRERRAGVDLPERTSVGSPPVARVQLGRGSRR